MNFKIVVEPTGAETELLLAAGDAQIVLVSHGHYDHLDLAKVVAALQARRHDQHIVVTGRNAKPELIAAADLVTEMTLVKHHFAAGVKAQPGIEF